MSLIILNVDEVRRTLSASGGAFVVHDKEVDIVRFAINSGFADIILDGQVALRVMYQRPGETEVRAKTLTYHDTDGLHNYYDWQLAQSDLAEKGTLTVALCILDISGGEVSEWHTTPCAVRVLSTIHTDDSDEGDDTITPTVKERVAVLETMIQRVASGAPIVVSSMSAMTDTEQIYVLSTNGRWYYHNGSAWVAGGEYGGVANGSVATDKLADGAVTTTKIADGAITARKIASGVIPAVDATLAQAGAAADAKAVGDEFTNLKSDLDSIVNVERIDLINGAVFEKGTINASTGEESGSTTRIRSDFIDVSETRSINVIPSAGYKYLIFCYTDDHIFIGSTLSNYYSQLSQAWITTTRTAMLVPIIKYIRIIISDSSDSTAIAPSDANNVKCLANYPLLQNQRDYSFGDELFYNWLNDGNAKIGVVWDSGVAQSGTGHGINVSTTRIISNPIVLPTNADTMELSANDGYKIGVLFYSEDFSKISEKFWASSYSVDIPDLAIYAIVELSTTDNETISPSEGANATIAFSVSDHVQRVVDITSEGIDLQWKLGTLSPNSPTKGREGASQKRIRSNFVLVGKGTEIICTDSAYGHLYYKYDLDREYVSDVSWTHEPFVIDEDCFIRILIRKNDDADIDANEVESIALKETIYRTIPQASVDIAGDIAGLSTDDIRSQAFNSSYHIGAKDFATKCTQFSSLMYGDTFVDVTAPRDCESFLFFTDPHLLMWSGWEDECYEMIAQIQKYYNSTPTSFCLCGGDWLGNDDLPPEACFKMGYIDGFMHSMFDNVYMIVGNHDTNYQGKLTAESKRFTTRLSNQSIIDLWYREQKKAYFSFNGTNTKFYAFDTGIENQALATFDNYGWEQVAWFAESLLTDDSEHIAVTAHILYYAYDATDLSAGIQPLMDNVLKIAQAYNNRTSITVNGTTYDYSSRAGKVEFCIGGHMHADAAGALYGIPFALTLNVRNNVSLGASFDLVFADYDNRIINLVRVGAGEDRTLSLT